MMGLMALVFLCGTLATWAAVRYAMREPLIESLRSE
jgi:hypothetical protein